MNDTTHPADTHPAGTDHARPPEDSAVRSFWMAGYEGADHINANGDELDMAASSGHLERLEEDHRRAAQAGLRCVRESIGWRLAESAGGSIDLSRAERIADSARRHGLQVAWTLMHYGVPPDLCLHEDALIDRFARFAGEVARVIGRREREAPLFTPVNEIGFLAWAATQPWLLHPPNNTPPPPGELDIDLDRFAQPHAESTRVSGYEVKRRLARAALAAMQTMREIDPRSRFLHVEPLVHVVPPRERPEDAPLAETVNGWQWQAWDLLAGMTEPELGGSPEWLDLIGVNHYHSSQWELGTEKRLDWWGRDPRRRPLSMLLNDAWQRYRRPLLVAETSFVGAGRAAWLHEMASEAQRARSAGVPVQGMCLYPAHDRPDWGAPTTWHRSGLWHVDSGSSEASLSRAAVPDYLDALRQWQRVLPAPQGPLDAAPPRPVLLAFSHLRWEFVRHRTRQLLSRLAGDWHVVVVEEPLPLLDGVAARLDQLVHGPNLEVLVPYSPVKAVGFCNEQQALLQALLTAWLAERRIAQPTVWMTTPMALPLAQALQPGAIVYDTSDELAGFIGAPAELPTLEARTLDCADVVFAAGPSLAASRRTRAGNRMRLLANGVDRSHFAVSRNGRAGWAGDEARLAQGQIPGPRFGFAGVIDERFDLALLDRLAQLRPDCHFVMAGPVVKITPEQLPLRPNIHWLGAQPYAVLPALMAGWAAGLLPLRMIAATLRSNPLKVFEYLAAGLPVIASPLPDVVALRHAGLHTAKDAASFATLLDAVLAETPAATRLRRRSVRRTLAVHDWDAVAALARRELLTVEHQAESTAAAWPMQGDVGMSDKPAAGATAAAAATTAPTTAITTAVSPTTGSPANPPPPLPAR